jgi:hypothetical protein
MFYQLYIKNISYLTGFIKVRIVFISIFEELKIINQIPNSIEDLVYNRVIYFSIISICLAAVFFSDTITFLTL